MPVFDKSAAYHEAGHAVLAIAQNIGILTSLVKWDENFQNWIGGTALRQTFDLVCPSPEFVRKHSIMNFGGCLSQAKFWSGNKSFDKHTASDLLAWMTRPDADIEKGYELGLSVGETINLEARSFAGADRRALLNSQDRFPVSPEERLEQICDTMDLVDVQWVHIVRVAEAFITSHASQPDSTNVTLTVDEIREAMAG